MKDKGTRIVTSERSSPYPVLIYGFERHGSDMHILFIQPVEKPAQGLRRITGEELIAIRNEAYQYLIA